MVMYYLLFDSDCVHCSEVARYIRDLRIPDLGIRSLRDPQVGDLLVSIGLEGRAPRPLLLRDDDGRLSVQAGIRMRVSLFRLLGLRKSMTVLHLAGTAQRARRHTGGHDITRRGALRWVAGGITVGAVAAVFGPRSAMAAERSTVSGQDVAALRATPAIKTAIASFGAPDWEKTAWYGRGRDRVAAIVHTSSNIVTFASDPARNATVTAVALRASQTGSRATLTWFEVNGAVLATQTFTGEETVRTVSAGGRTIETDRDGRRIIVSVPATVEEPDLCWPSCFGECLGESIPLACYNNCVHCASGQGCGGCLACVGIKGVNCAKKCYTECHGEA
jgi:hypothetical protein